MPLDAIVHEEAALKADEYLSAAEVMAAYNALSDDDKIRLIAIERRYLGGTSHQCVGENNQSKSLFNEALYRTLIGERHCPRNLSLVAFLAKTMQSISFHDREGQKRLVSLDAEGDHAEEGYKAPDEIVSEDQLDPEECLLEKEKRLKEYSIVSAIRAHFKDDEECQLLFLGWEEGIRGKELRDLVGFDQKGLDYLIKRIRRDNNKLYPKGWPR
jgi:hypothetical protein